MPHADRRLTLLSTGVLCCALWMGFAGCSRPFWRTQADFDTYNVLMEKTADERWDLPRISLESDPRSRIFDPFDPDLEPLPPDDPMAHMYMHWVDGMRGYKSWHKFGQEMSVENPHWMSQFEFAEEEYGAEWLKSNAEGSADCPPVIVPTIRNLTLEQAIELANINSRDYQLQLENTYLAALALTFERFRFNVRYLGIGGAEPTSNLNYSITPENLSTLSFANRFGISQLLPTGGQWIVELANNTLWIFSAPSDTSSASVISYSLVQPLLQGAGRKIVLEDLTQSERQVLYNIRTLARFRKIFFSDVVVNASGYLTILQQTQVVENQRFNIRERQLQIEKIRAANANPNRISQEALESLPDGFEIPDDFATRLRYDPVEKLLIWKGEMLAADEDRLRNLSDDPAARLALNSIIAQHTLQIITLDLAQLLNQQAAAVNGLRTSEAGLLRSIDAFKLQLGLPTDMQITIDPSMLQPFQLIDPSLQNIEDQLLEVVQAWGELDDSELTQPRLRAMGQELEAIRQQIGTGGIEMIQHDLDREAAQREQRLARLKSEAEHKQALQNVQRDRLLFLRIQEDNEFLQRVLIEVDRLLADYDLPLESDEPPTIAEGDAFPDLLTYVRDDVLPKRAEIPGLLRNIREDLLQLVNGLKAVQSGVRADLITLPEFEMCLEDTIALALENRLDLMNARGQVMDARREMEVAANRMEGILNLVTRGDIRNSGGVNPFDFRGDRSTFQVGVQFTAPLDQVLVRNDYRASQIAYQQARRAYMQLEDNVKLQVRDEWRQLKLLEGNFEISRQNLRFAAMQLDLAVENASITQGQGQAAIPQVGGAVLRGTGGGNQGLNLLQALQTILGAQNELIRIWVEYERNRINIHRDMDIMQVDERGVWVDKAYLGPTLAPPALPKEPAHVIPPERIERAGGPVAPQADGLPLPISQDPLVEPRRVRLAGDWFGELDLPELPSEVDQSARWAAAED